MEVKICTFVYVFYKAFDYFAYYSQAKNLNLAHLSLIT